MCNADRASVKIIIIRNKSNKFGQKKQARMSSLNIFTIPSVIQINRERSKEKKNVPLIGKNM